MKAEINKDGALTIIAGNSTEAFAINVWVEKNLTHEPYSQMTKSASTTVKEGKLLFTSQREGLNPD